MFKSLSRDDKYGHYAYLFLAPFFIVLAVFVMYPIIYTLGISVTEWDGVNTMRFNGLDNFKRLIGDEYFIQSITNTWIIWALNVIPQMIIGLFLAVILTERKLKGKEFLRAVYYLPNLVTMTSVATLFYLMLDKNSGTLNRILIGFNLMDPQNTYDWFQDITAMRLTVAFILFWMWFGYSMIIFMAGIKSIPEDLYEAAHVDGASRWNVFWKITLPLLKPIMLYQVITSLIGGLSMFDIPYVLSGGEGAPQYSLLTMVMYIYNKTFRHYQYGYGAAVAVGLFIHILIFVSIAYKMMNLKSDKK